MDSLPIVDIKRLIQSRIEAQEFIIKEIEAGHITYTLAIKDFVIKQLKYSIDILKLLSGDVDVEALNDDESAYPEYRSEE